MTHQYITKFDLPHDCKHDHVTVEWNDSDDFPFVATPFDKDSTGYTEPETWDVTDRYINAIRNRTETPIELIKLLPPKAVQGGNL